MPVTAPTPIPTTPTPIAARPSVRCVLPPPDDEVPVSAPAGSAVVVAPAGVAVPVAGVATTAGDPFGSFVIVSDAFAAPASGTLSFGAAGSHPLLVALT